jgi:hypothetical protein
LDTGSLIDRNEIGGNVLYEQIKQDETTNDHDHTSLPPSPWRRDVCRHRRHSSRFEGNVASAYLLIFAVYPPVDGHAASTRWSPFSTVQSLLPFGSGHCPAVSLSAWNICAIKAERESSKSHAVRV